MDLSSVILEVARRSHGPGRGVAPAGFEGIRSIESLGGERHAARSPGHRPPGHHVRGRRRRRLARPATARRVRVAQHGRASADQLGRGLRLGGDSGGAVSHSYVVVVLDGSPGSGREITEPGRGWFVLPGSRPEHSADATSHDRYRARPRRPSAAAVAAAVAAAGTARAGWTGVASVELDADPPGAAGSVSGWRADGAVRRVR